MGYDEEADNFLADHRRYIGVGSCGSTGADRQDRTGWDAMTAASNPTGGGLEMTPLASIQDIVDELAGDPLRHIVLLKHLQTYREHAEVHRVSNAIGVATLVVLKTAVIPYDNRTYPRAAVVAFISSDHPDLTASLLPHVPRGVGIVFKLSCSADVAPVESRFAIKRRTAFVSFTSDQAFERAAGVHITTDPGDAALELFEAQGHERSWLEPLLRSGRAFACVLDRDGDIRSACFAFENYGPVWEVGGVATAPLHRRKGLAARVVTTALAELSDRGLIPRYSVEEHNKASIGLAQSVGLASFLTIVHHEHER